MMSIADEIQAVSENADKSVNYPIGDKLEAFMRQQDESNQTNFVLSGVLILAAAKIYGRKVDYLEQEIHGIAKNFEAVGENDEPKPEIEEKKKRRTKKFLIKDGVSLEKTSFEEKPIQVMPRVDINKTLAVPSKINRLQRMKEFFSKNKSRGGKIVIPKNLLFTNDFVLSNFGSTQIYDFDDSKEIVGSRRDFTSFSYFVNGHTGELQSDLSASNPSTRDDNFDRVGDESMIPEIRIESPVAWNVPNSPCRSKTPSRPNTPEERRSVTPINRIEPEELPKDRLESSDLPETNIEQAEPPNIPDKDIDLNINLDEGIEVCDEERASLLLQAQPAVKLIDIRQRSPSVVPPDLGLNETVDVTNLNLENSQEAAEFETPKTPTKDKKMVNLFMIPVKRLLHRCIFDLPNDEYGELKKQKREQYKSAMAADSSMRQARAFKTTEMLKSMLEQNEPPFLGFTEEQQKQPMTFLPDSPVRRQRSRSPIAGRKLSNDSGLENDCEDDVMNFELSEDLTLAPEESDKVQESSQTSKELESSLEASKSDETDREVSNILDVSAGDSLLNTSFEASQVSETNAESTVNSSSEQPLDTSNNISSGDSCYQSLMSGESSKTDVSSFFKDIESQNNATLESDEQQEESAVESEEHVLQMQQSAVNIAKWKEYLKPILADSEARSKIDMHQYGIELINKVGNVNDSATFHDITEAGKSPAYFLTMLQLINNRNVEISHGERSMTEPVDTKNIKITLKSKTLHREKFDEMGAGFVLEEEKKTNLKRKAVKTSTPAKAHNSSKHPRLSFNTPNLSIDQEEEIMSPAFSSQASSGYFSQSSTFSDF